MRGMSLIRICRLQPNSCQLACTSLRGAASECAKTRLKRSLCIGFDLQIVSIFILILLQHFRYALQTRDRTNRMQSATECQLISLMRLGIASSTAWTHMTELAIIRKCALLQDLVLPLYTEFKNSLHVFRLQLHKPALQAHLQNTSLHFLPDGGTIGQSHRLSAALV